MVFALGPDSREREPGVAVSVRSQDLGYRGAIRVRDVWERRDLGVFEGRFAPVFPWHGVGLYRVGRAR